MSRGRVDDTKPEPPKKLQFGEDRVCSSCKGKGHKNKHTCWTCGGSGIERKGRKGE